MKLASQNGVNWLSGSGLPIWLSLPKHGTEKVTGKVVVGREVTFDLKTLDEALIRKNASSGFDLYFEMTVPLAVVQRLAFSSEPDKWIDVPPLPLASTMKLSGSDDKKYAMLIRARIAWASQASGLESDIPGYEIASFASNQDTNSQEGLQRLHDNRMRTFLLLSTSGHFGHAVRPMGQEARSLVTTEFIDTIKEVLSQCKK